MHRSTVLVILAYYAMRASNADRVYNPFNPAPDDPHNWTLPSVTG